LQSGSKFLYSARTAGLVLAFVLLLAAFSKGMDLTRFARGIEDLIHAWGFAGPGVVRILSAIVALTVVGLELILGALLLFDGQRRSTRWTVLAMIFGFTMISGWEVIAGLDRSCGCFGVLLPRSAPASLIENVILLALATTLIIPQRRTAAVDVPVASSRKRAVSRPWYRSPWMLVTVGVVWCIAFYLFPPGWSAVRVGSRWIPPEASPVLPNETNLLVWVMNPECPKCLQHFDQVNYSSVHGVYIVALTDVTLGRVNEFTLDYAPYFSVHRVDSKVTERLGLPSGSLFLVEGGRVIRLWRLDEIGNDWIVPLSDLLGNNS